MKKAKKEEKVQEIFETLEEKFDEEVVTIEPNKDRLKKLARILEKRQADYQFDQLNGDFSLRCLAYYFSPGLGAAQANELIRKKQEKLIFSSNGDEELEFRVITDRNFTPGDRIIMNENANERYAKTKEGSTGILVNPNENGTFRIKFTKVTGYWKGDEEELEKFAPEEFDIEEQFMNRVEVVKKKAEKNIGGNGELIVGGRVTSTDYPDAGVGELRGIKGNLGWAKFPDYRGEAPGIGEYEGCIMLALQHLVPVNVKFQGDGQLLELFEDAGILQFLKKYSSIKNLEEEKLIKELRDKQQQKEGYESYLDCSVFSLAAAKKLNDMYPKLEARAEQINSIQELEMFLDYFYFTDLIEKKGMKVNNDGNDITEILKEKYPGYFELAKTGKNRKEAMEQLFGKDLRLYEQAMLLAEIDSSLVKKVFTKDELTKDFSVEKARVNQDYVPLYNEIMSRFFRERGKDYELVDLDYAGIGTEVYFERKGKLEKGKIADVDEEDNILGEINYRINTPTGELTMPKNRLKVKKKTDDFLGTYKKLNIDGYENACLEFVMDLNRAESTLFQDIRKEVEAGVVFDKKPLDWRRKMIFNAAEKNLEAIFNG